MSTNRIIGIVLVAAGAVVLWKGWDAYQSVGSSIGRALGSGPSNQTLLMLIGGAVLVIVGVVLAVRR